MKIFLTCKLYSTDPTQVAKENKINSVPWCKHFDKINGTYVAISIISYTWCHNYKKKKRKEKKKKEGHFKVRFGNLARALGCDAIQ